jgi:hypothetical protein
VRNDPILRRVPVIVVSGLITEESEDRVLSAGATPARPNMSVACALTRRLQPFEEPDREWQLLRWFVALIKTFKRESTRLPAASARQSRLTSTAPK